ncbi:hypothetical protein P43SY_000574 [Pythium insidiosum]|uniref:EamA domain-containing protein n=1 Tax=Pythium insidiosum TaxID=114742 RepID=A0AAD5LW45_PYTIN|nr:hypothetical protein P43SY_000574 [Pythium insidiosum]
MVVETGVMVVETGVVDVEIGVVDVETGAVAIDFFVVSDAFLWRYILDSPAPNMTQHGTSALPVRNSYGPEKPAPRVDETAPLRAGKMALPHGASDAHPHPHAHGRRALCPSMSIRVAGLLALAALIWSWVVQAEASQALQVLLLPLVCLFFKCCGTPCDRYETPWYAIPTLLQRHTVLPFAKACRIAAFLSIFYCAADYFWYAALSTVSVAAGTAIFNCSPLFVYCFSICFLGERISLKKIYGVLTAFVGVTLILMYQDDGSGGSRLDLSAVATLESSSFAAGMLVVLSAALYAAYEVSFKVAVGDDLTDTATLLIITGLSGLFTIPIWILGSFVLAYSPFDSLYEPLGWPTSADGLAMLFLSGSLAVTFNIAMPLSLCWTSPLETSVGCMLTIPLSGLLDTVLHRTHFAAECIVGSVLVMLGFAILEYATPPHAESTDTDEDSSEQTRVEPDEERLRASQSSAASTAV